jgi:small subunit ribosomal protein S1
MNTSISTNTINTESFADLFQQTLLEADMRPGMTVSAKIVRMDNNRIVVSAGLKSDALIPSEEFEGEKVAIGDEIYVTVESLEDGFGNARVSREKARRNETWGVLEKAFAENQPITGLVTERVKGGYTVNINSIRAFLPGSLVDSKAGRDTISLEGKELEFKIIKIDQKRNNVVISRRAAMDSEVNQEQRDRLLDSLEEGKEIVGIVKNITDYGAFIDLGGIDGLLHITDMSWKRVKHPNEVLQVGDSITVRVLKYDREKKRVSLGLKQMGMDPWQDIARRYPPKARLFGHVTNLMDYGCFVQIEEGIEGLVHVSEIDWTNKNVHPSKLLKLNDEVEVMVLEIDEPRRRISLGIKQCLPNPWDEFAKTYSKGDQVSGQIKSITDFGLFIGLEGGIDGLVHSSDLSWSESGETLIRKYKKGDEVTAVILAIDSERERISLGVKQLENDPFSHFLETHPKGEPVKGQVQSLDAKRALIDLGDGLQGHLRIAEISAEAQVGDSVEIYVSGLDRKTGIFNLSNIPSSEEAPAKEPRKSAKKEAPQDVSNTTLGDLLREHMEGKE